MSADGTATRSICRMLLAMLVSLMLAATACSGEADVEQIEADGSGALDEPAQPGHPPTPTPTELALPWDRGVIAYTADDPRRIGDLVAQDPDTGEVHTLVDDDSIESGLVGRLITSAAWSVDGRWIAFETMTIRCSAKYADGTGGLWVHGQGGEPRALTRACFRPDVFQALGTWAWSPAGTQLVLARSSIRGTSLLVIDPTTGERSDLGETAGPVTALAWSPDGTRIAYAARGSIYLVGVGGGMHRPLASSLGYVYGDGGSGLAWSPDGARIAVLALKHGGTTLHLMNADGSDLQQVAEDIQDHVALSGSPGLSWSPDGTMMAYALAAGGRDQRRIQIWTRSADGSSATLISETAPQPAASIWIAGGPVWSPDGTQVAFALASTIGSVWRVVHADGTGDAREIDELRYLSWRGGWYFCHCYG